VSADLTPTPRRIPEMVNGHIYSMKTAIEINDNVDAYDESQRYSLHRLAAQIYAAGWSDGHLSASIETRKP
jgi:hypothetical protein